jgi:hypothetical protein
MILPPHHSAEKRSFESRTSSSGRTRTIKGAIMGCSMILPRMILPKGSGEGTRGVLSDDWRLGSLSPLTARRAILRSGECYSSVSLISLFAGAGGSGGFAERVGKLVLLAG